MGVDAILMAAGLALQLVLGLVAPAEPRHNPPAQQQEQPIQPVQPVSHGGNK
jgi:hypothetical protein